MDRIDDLLKTTGDIALRRRAKWIIKSLQAKNGEHILDLGCGDGFYLHLLSNLGLNLTLYGADYDKNALKSAEKNLKLKKIKFVQANLMKKLPFPDNFFDGIVMSEVMEHLPDDILGMKEVKRVLKESGRVVLSVPHINYPFWWDPINWILQKSLKTHIKNGFWAGIWNQHIRLYSPESLIPILKKVGFNNIKTARLTHYCLPFNHHIINLVARILVYKSTPKLFKKRISKFNLDDEKKVVNFNPFWILFKFDSLNDNWDGKGSAVSLVALAKK